MLPRVCLSSALRFVLLLAPAAIPLAAQPRDAMPVPNLPGYITLKGDFHAHTVFSDGEVWPTIRVMEAWRDGLDVIAFTDHAGYNPHSDDVKLDLRRPYAIAKPLADRLGIIAVPGVEVMEGDTHCNALFVSDPNVFMGLSLIEALRKARKEDAFVFWNHPGWKGTPEWNPLIAGAHEEGLIQGVELVNGLDFYPEVFPWVAEKRLTIFANSDVHGTTSTEYPRRTRPITLLFAKTADLAGVREALLARRTAAWVRGELWGNENHLRGLWEGAVTVENAQIRCALGAEVALRLRNLSAIPFKVRVVGRPAWLIGGDVEVHPDTVDALPLGLAADAPRGAQSVDLELEITNLYPAPGKRLVVRVPLRIEVTR